MGVDHFLDFFVLFALGAPTCCCVAEVYEELVGYESENDVNNSCEGGVREKTRVV
jgi:hypothetical protein